MKTLLKLAANNPFGNIAPPPGADRIGGGNVGGLAVLLNIIFKTMIVGAGIYAVFNFILAGYAYISAAGDSKAIQSATAKIWQTVIGLIIASGAIALAGLIGRIFFGDPSILLKVTIFTP